MKIFVALFGLILLPSIPFEIHAQHPTYFNQIYSESIKTLKVCVEGNEQSYPAVELNSDTKILIRFDDLVTAAKNYSYQIVHCNYDWTASDLQPDEYLHGYSENVIHDYEFSTNTRIPYVNYTITLPNTDVQFKISGNYVLNLIENNNSDNILLSARFIVYETIMGIKAEILRPKGAREQDNSQELRLSINHDQLDINDPFTEVKVFISQNNRPDRALDNIKPVFVRDKELIYSYTGEIMFPAGNEFRTFASTNIHKYGLNVNDIQFVDTIYHVQLRLDERRSFKKYNWDEDMNGKFIVYLDNNPDAFRSADYAYVYFSLPIEEPFLDGKVYVFGAFTQWKTNEDNQMQYNFNAKMYESKLLLKQGYYNYIFAYYNNYTKQLDETVLEGSHFQTENDYIIYVYFRGFSERYDRLVGYRVVNSKYQE